jgi:hypothetical protein
MAQIQKIPTNKAFQRLSSFPLDGSCLFQTLAQAEAYCNGPVAYAGQVIYVADARTQEEIRDAYSAYDKVFFINKEKMLLEFAGSDARLISESQIDNAFDSIFGPQNP